ncbi:MAG: 3-keto-5-aminohexanoate cleavage protein [Janthinobacterium lividum]
MDKLIIECRVNEYMMRDVNPHVPWTADELARDAAAIEAAGASMLHFHARKPDGSPAHDFGTYRDAVQGIRGASRLMIHSTLGQITIQGDEARAAHITRLAAEGMAPEFASVDLGSTNIDIYDPAAKRYTSTNKTYVNTTETLTSLLRSFEAAGVRPVIACWSIPFLRTIEPFFEMGLLSGPVYVLLIHTGGGQLGGHPPTAAGLRAFTDHLPNRPIHWAVCSKPGNLFPNAASAIQQGGHISIGIGDHTYVEMGTPTNADLVRQVVEMAKSCGREIATPEEARRMLGVTK